MQYLVRNTTSFTSGIPVTIMIESSSQWNNIILKPGDTEPITEAALAQLNTIPQYKGMYSVIGPFTDPGAPVALTVTLSATWTLVTLGKFCTNFKFITTATNCLVSFSGWNAAAGETAPAVQYQIPIVPDTTTDGNAFTLDMVMDSTRSMFVKGTGSLTIVGV